jgi:hypothetical protein
MSFGSRMRDRAPQALALAAGTAVALAVGTTPTPGTLASSGLGSRSNSSSAAGRSVDPIGPQGWQPPEGAVQVTKDSVAWLSYNDRAGSVLVNVLAFNGAQLPVAQMSTPEDPTCKGVTMVNSILAPIPPDILDNTGASSGIGAMFSSSRYVDHGDEHGPEWRAADVPAGKVAETVLNMNVFTEEGKESVGIRILSGGGGDPELTVGAPLDRQACVSEIPFR